MRQGSSTYPKRLGIWGLPAQESQLQVKIVHYFPLAIITNYHRLSRSKQLKSVILWFCSSEVQEDYGWSGSISATHLWEWDHHFIAGCLTSHSFSSAGAHISRLLASFKASNAMQAGDTGSTPGLERSPGEGNGYPHQYSCLEEFHGQRSLTSYIVHAVTKCQIQLSSWLSQSQ